MMAYDGTVPVPSLAMVMAFVSIATQQKGWSVAFHYRVGDSILPRARNAEAAKFVEDKDATDFIMIDADTLCDPADLVKLIEYDADIVGAAYRTRNEPLAWPSVRWLHQDIRPREDGLLEAEAVGTGLIKISKRALQQLWDAEPLHYRDPTTVGGNARGVFWFEIKDGHLWGEDIVFCRKWRALGGNVFTDPTIQTSHIGAHSFTGKLEDWLKEQPPLINVDDVVGQKTTVRNFYSQMATIAQDTKSEAA